MHFSHSGRIWADFPELVPGVLHVEGLHPKADVTALVERFNSTARERLTHVASESELPEIQAWRRAFARMGLKPTQYRCASESLLRRFRKDGSLPGIHPLVDVCNAVSLAFAIPIAVFDLDAVAEWLEVRPASGTESYLAFSGETERPEAGEIIFADAGANAHARRWTNRQSGLSAVREGTSRVLIVAEALHASAPQDVRRLLEELDKVFQSAWGVSPQARVLDPAGPRFEFSSS